MARLQRQAPIGIPQHIIQRGNNRQVCFGSEQDLATYAGWLTEYAAEFSVSVHAWVFMTNHIHLLATPRQDGAVSKMMQALGRRYVRYFNRQYQRTGTLWEGRFKSCLVQSESYLLKCQRYIEMNPVRAGMVEQPAEYRWSSFHCNGYGAGSKLWTPHEEYLRLGDTREIRCAVYRQLFRSQIENGLLQEIRQGVNKGLALGNNRFKDEIEALIGQRVRPGKMGRPSKHSGH